MVGADTLISGKGFLKIGAIFGFGRAKFASGRLQQADVVHTVCISGIDGGAIVESSIPLGRATRLG
jgi:hypothetical protein